jgi:hypothetical protein
MMATVHATYSARSFVSSVSYCRYEMSARGLVILMQVRLLRMLLLLGGKVAGATRVLASWHVVLAACLALRPMQASNHKHGVMCI